MKVGSMVVVALLLFAYFAIKVDSLRLPWKSKGYIINVFFNNIAGLEEKSPVRLAGVRIGTVQKIQLENGQARIEVEINPGVSIPKDAVANVSQMGIMGEKYLEIVGGTNGGPVLKEGDIVQGDPPTSFDQVITVINSIGQDIQSITTSLRRVLASEEGEEHLNSIVENIRDITTELSEMLALNKEGLGATIANLEEISYDLRNIISDGGEPFTRTLNNIEQFSGVLSDKGPGLVERLDELIAHINQLLPSQSEDVEGSLKNIREATNDLKESVASVKNIVGKIEAGEGTIGKLVSDDQTHTNLNAALTNLEDTLKEAKDMLGRVGSYETSLGYRAEYINTNETWKHFISLKLQPRHDKYYLIEIIDSPYGYPSETTTYTHTESTTTPSGKDFTSDVWRTELKTEDKFLINLQVAKEFHNLTFRAGLIETQGGVGLDLGLWRQHVTLSLDGWDFGRDNDSFHLKLSGRIKVYHGIYLFGGWDDIFYDLNNDTTDTYFVGAGVLFTDEDLKYLLGIAASASSM